MIERRHSGGSRQTAWDKLHLADFATVEELGVAVGCPGSSLRPYVAALEKRGYVRRLATGHIHLDRYTGPRAPSWSVHTDDFRDWNLDPPMAGEELARLIDLSGLSIAQWVRAADLPRPHSTRVRQMINGQRPVTPIYADAATRLAKEATGQPANG